MPDLLLEVGCEELPSSACREIIEQAPGLVRSALDSAGLNGAGVRVSVAGRPLGGWGVCRPASNATPGASAPRGRRHGPYDTRR